MGEEGRQGHRIIRMGRRQHNVLRITLGPGALLVRVPQAFQYQ